mgnify:CR=1 FL=1
MNSISEMSWESAKSTLGAALNLKGGSKELKGPCPNCGGTDRFWIKKGNKLPFIFGCRQGCTFVEIAKELANRGLVKNGELSREEIYKFKMESPVPYQMNVWAEAVVDLIIEDGEVDDEGILLFVKAIEVLKRARDNGIAKMDDVWVWDIAALREKGVLNEYL